MERALVTMMSASFERSHNFLMQFIDECPEAIWEQTYGGYSVWQQVYHSLLVYRFFVKNKDEYSCTGLFDSDERDILHFTVSPKAPCKNDIIGYAKTVKTEVDSFISSLVDADLQKKHEGISSRIGRDLTNLELLSLLSTHNMYHLGACDAALRGNGLKGIY